MVATVKWFNDSKGYGFAETEDGEIVFCHWSQIKMDGYKTLKQGQKIRFDSYEKICKNGEVATEAKNIEII